MSINIPLNIVIGNTVESAMFALLTNANFIYNAKNSYYLCKSVVQVNSSIAVL